VTDQDGRVQLAWKPGGTVLFIPAVNFFPMYWAGGSTFSNGIEGARIVQAADLDAQRQVTIPIPVILAAWPERTESCTNQQLYAHSPRGFFQQTLSLGDGLADLLQVIYGVNLITFIRDDNGQEMVLCGADTGFGCVDPRAGFVAEDVNRVGQVVGRLVRDVSARHTRQVVSAGGLEPIGPPTCDNEYAEVEVIPVTVGEE
jgi:hypothetical protein